MYEIFCEVNQGNGGKIQMDLEWKNLAPEIKNTPPGK